MARYRYGYGWKPYVPVAQRREQAARKIARLKKKGIDIHPIRIEGRQIARTFWGKSWCKHLEKFSDYSNRLPRGRTYLRNGSVCHLEIGPGVVEAMVMGSKLYNVKVKIKALPKKKWLEVRKRCAGGIGSLLELLEGRLSKSVMEVVTDRDAGLFPLPHEISLACDCPDWAVMCKHVASVLYGVGARLDESPELLFTLRRVNQDDLISEGAEMTTATQRGRSKRKRIAEGDLSEVFGVEFTDDSVDGSDRKKKVIRRPRREKQAPVPARRSAKPVMRKRSTEKPGKKQTNLDQKSRGAAKQRPASNVTGTVRAGMDTSRSTGKTVRSLRNKFGMSKGEFSRLLGVSATTITNWEKKRGRIKFQSRTLEAWNSIVKLSRKKAWQRLESV